MTAETALPATVVAVHDVVRLNAEDLDRIPEVDVSEEVDVIYLQHGTELERLDHPHNTQTRSPEEWSSEIGLWQSFVGAGGASWGVFNHNRLVGFAVLRIGLTDDTAQLAGLYVERARRRTGIGRDLVDAVVEGARQSEADKLYVSATRSETAVSFYLRYGFLPVADPHPELFDLEPKDIHMSMDL